MFKSSGFDIWRLEQNQPKVMTLCKTLDEHLGGGITTGLITELCGMPGSGKTQMCLQLCLNVQFPREVGGIGGKALYLDTNQGFHPVRYYELAQCMEKRFLHTFRHMYTVDAPQLAFNVETLLANCSYVYCDNYKQLMQTVDNLNELVNQEPELKLIIIDSFSFLLRTINESRTRVGIICALLTDLQQLAAKHQIAIVITNELSTRVCGDNHWQICPCLGDSHAHKINQRLIFSKDKETDQRIVSIEKSVGVAKRNIPFVIKQSGIRGVS